MYSCETGVPKQFVRLTMHSSLPEHGITEDSRVSLKAEQTRDCSG